MQSLRPLVRQALMWVLRLSTVVVLFFAIFLIQRLWQELASRTSAKVGKSIDRNVGHFSINDSINTQSENVRYVNLFLDDIIITSNRPKQLRVADAPAAKVDRWVSPDIAPAKEGESMSASSYQPPPPPEYRHRTAHESDDDEDVATTVDRRLSLRASLQGLTRVGLLARLPLDKRWSVEAGLTYGHLKTVDNRNSCLAIPLHAVYYMKTSHKLEYYALGGTTIEKICKGGTSLQLLLQAGVGAEYHISRKWGVFMEPSLRYHIGNDNNIPSLYGKRLGLNIHLGVTFTP